MDKKEEEKFLKTYSKKTGKSLKELREILEASKEEAKKRGQGENWRVIKGIFGRKLRGRIRFEATGQKRREPELVKGFILGCGRLRDTMELMRLKCIKAFRENPEEAVLEGFTDEMGNPLDYRERIRDRTGKEIDNPNYHKPLIGHNYVRDVYGVLKRDKDEKAKLWKTTLWGGFATKFKYRPFVPVQIPALIKSEKPYITLTISRARDARIKPIDEDIPIEKWIREALEDRKYELDELEQAVADTENAIDKEIMIEGTVDYIDSQVNPRTGTRSIVINDVDKGILDGVRVFIPKDFPLAFREYSRVIVLGIPRRWKREDEEEYRYSLNGISIYPIPSETVEAPLELPVEEEEEGEEGYNLWEE